MIKAYGISHSRALRTLWMLEELELPYEHVPLSFAGDTRKPDFLKLNPNGHIPVLDDDGFVIWESMAINLYLAMKYDKGLWPKALQDQARAIQWSVWAMTEVEPPLMTALMNRLMLPAAQRDARKADEAAASVSQGALRVLDTELAGRECLAGERFSVADLNVASVVGLTALAQVDTSGHRNLSAWLKRCIERPANMRARSK